MQTTQAQTPNPLPNKCGLFSLPCSIYNIPTFVHWFIPAWILVTFVSGLGTTCPSGAISMAFGNVLGYLLVLGCLYLHMLVQALQQRKVPGGVVYKFVMGPFFAWWHGKHDGGPAAEMKILLAGQFVGVPCIVVSGLLYLATDGPNIFKHYCDSFFANIWAELFSYNLLLLVLLFAPYYPFEGGRFWVCWCFNRGCSKVETLRFVYKLGIFYAAFLGLVGIVALSTMSINGTVYMLCGIWGGIQSYQLHKLHQMLHLMYGEENASSLDVKHPILNVCVPCDGKIPTADAVPTAGQLEQGADGVPSAAPVYVAQPAPQVYVAQPAPQDAFGVGAGQITQI